MKTAATVLQEMMVKLSKIPEYECIAQSGPPHQMTFDYRCTACGITVLASAHSKKEAKQEAAKLMLYKLAESGYSVPPPFGLAAPPPAPSITKSLPSSSSEPPKLEIRSYVALLKEFCDEYKLPACEFDIVDTTGPPHMRQFTMEARVGRHSRRALASTKKAARQIAAEQLYTYLRENLAKHTKDFEEEQALIRAHEKAMDRYLAELDQQPLREDLGQKISEYHLGLLKHIDEEKRTAAVGAMEERPLSDEAIEEALSRAVDALGLSLNFSQMGPLHLVEISPASPDLMFAARQRPLAAKQALHYLQMALKV